MLVVMLVTWAYFARCHNFTSHTSAAKLRNAMLNVRIRRVKRHWSRDNTRTLVYFVAK
jgi:hypothetical protein